MDYRMEFAGTVLCADGPSIVMCAILTVALLCQLNCKL